MPFMVYMTNIKNGNEWEILAYKPFKISVLGGILLINFYSKRRRFFKKKVDKNLDRRNWIVNIFMTFKHSKFMWIIIRDEDSFVFYFM